MRTTERVRVPRLRFPGFEQHWNDRSLDAISQKITSGSRDWAQYYSDRGALFVRMTNLPRSGIDLLLHDLKFVELPTAGSEGERTALLPNDILISITAELGKIGFVPESIGEAYINQHTALVRPNSQMVSPRFIAQYLATYQSNKRLNRLNDSGAKSGLNLSTVKAFKASIPSLPEQKKIADFLGAVDGKLSALREKEAALTRFKRGLMQALFSQTLRFTRDDGSSYPDWEKVRLSKVMNEHGHKSDSSETVFSVSVHKGLVNQVEHLGRSFAAKNTDHYNRVLPGDVVYTKSPTGDFPLGIVKQSRIEHPVIVSPLYGVFTPETFALGIILDAYFCSAVNTSNYLKPIVQKGAKNTINVTNSGFLSNKLWLPRDPEEQQKIASALTAMDAKISTVGQKVARLSAFKKGLLQQMFV